MKKRNFLLLGLALMATSLSWAQPKEVTFGAIQPLWSTANDEGYITWGDIDNDGFKDVFSTSKDGAFLYKNNGNGTFQELQAGYFKALQLSMALFIDIDNDGYLDLVTVGKKSGTCTVIVYKNDDGVFAEDATLSAQLAAGAVSNNENRHYGRMMQAVDFDNDGWTDLIIGGYNQAGTSFTRIFKNVEGSFVKQTGNVPGYALGDFPEVRGGSVHVGDVNRDGFADIFLVGYINPIAATPAIPAGYVAHLYINNGDGTFTKSNEAFSGSEIGGTIFADINSDGYDDIVEILNWPVSCNNAYINNKNGTFTKTTGIGLINANNQTSFTVGDVNNDGLLDFLITTNVDAIAPGNIFYNKGTSTPSFIKSSITNTATSGFKRGMNPNLVDVDNDGDLDYSVGGVSMSTWTSGFAINQLGVDVLTNAAPTAPAIFEVEYTDGKYILSWNAGNDDTTPAVALRYNVYAEDQESGMVYMYAPADLTDGRLKIGGDIVPLVKATSFEWNLPKANYIFGVQAIDLADAASKFCTVEGPKVGISKVSKSIMNVFATGKTIFIENAADFTVTTVNGQVIAKGAGKQSISGLASGVYIVKTADKAVKVLVF